MPAKPKARRPARKAQSRRYLIQAIVSKQLAYATKAVALIKRQTMTELISELVLDEIKRVDPDQLRDVPEAR